MAIKFGLRTPPSFKLNHGFLLPTIEGAILQEPSHSGPEWDESAPKIKIIKFCAGRFTY